MKPLIQFRSKCAKAGLAFMFASAAFGRAAAVIHVPANYATIQAAVNAAASGDEIKIAAGVYTEQVLITNKNLTLSGSPGAVLRATPGMNQTLAGYGAADVALLGVALSEVNVSGLTFEGERLADRQSSWFDGIYYLASSGAIADCRIMGFRGTNLLTSDQPDPAGIFVNNRVRHGTGEVTVEVLRSTFADNGNSIWIDGDGENPTLLRTHFKVNDNTIVGNGPNATGRQGGIHIDPGAGGEVKRNTITDHAYVGTTEPIRISQGIGAFHLNFCPDNSCTLAPLQPIHFESNVFRNNQHNLSVLQGDGSTIVNNSFEGRVTGYRPTGLIVSGDNMLLGTNRFNDLKAGILLLGNDPDFGTSLGIASNATLIANSFCNVTTNIIVEPLVSHTELGTLGCLNGGPTLNIRAVQLSWPYSFNGYSVETAIDAGGPWMPAAATPFAQDGQNNVLMPMDSDRQFFRLRSP